MLLTNAVALYSYPACDARRETLFGEEGNRRSRENMEVLKRNMVI